MPSSLFREMATGMVAVVSGMMFLVFLIHSLRTYHLYKHENWWPQVEPPASITLFMLGALIYNGSYWLARHLYNQDQNADHLVSTFMVLIVTGTILKILGGLGMIKQFSLSNWKHYVWVFTLVSCLCMGAFCYWSYIMKWGTANLW